MFGAANKDKSANPPIAMKDERLFVSVLWLANVEMPTARKCQLRGVHNAMREQSRNG